MSTNQPNTAAWALPNTFKSGESQEFNLSRSPDAVEADPMLLQYAKKQDDTTSLLLGRRLIESDDILPTILSFLNYSAAENVFQTLCKPSSARSFPILWREIFQRRGFSSMMVQNKKHYFLDDDVDYRAELRYRYKLLESILNGPNRSTVTSITTAMWRSAARSTTPIWPSQHRFSFLPRNLLCGSSIDDYLRRNRSSRRGLPALLQFQLLSTATCPQLMFLDRDVHGRTTVAVQDDAIVTQAITPSTPRRNLEQAALEIQNEAAPLTPSSHQILWQETVDENIELLPVKPILGLQKGNDATGLPLNSVVVGIMLQHSFQETEFQFQKLGGNDNSKLKNTTWYCKVRHHSESSQTLRNSTFMIDFAARVKDDDEEPLLVFVASNELSDNDTTNALATASRIEVYRAISIAEETSADFEEDQKCCSRPEFVMDCGEEIVTMCASPLGNKLVVITAPGNLQFWNVNDTKNVSLSEEISIPKALFKTFRGLSVQRPESFVGALIGDLSINATSTNATADTRVQARICVPSHLPLQTCGFVTVHSSNRTLNAPGVNSVLFWESNHQTESCPLEKSWQIYAMINLPLLPAERPPQVYYDGNRLVVLGRDHIGPIILVYRVLSTLESVVDKASLCQPQPFASLGQASSAGVYNFSVTPVPRVEFACRIRNDALGGIEATDYLQMHCNERFVVVHTKRGDRLHDGVAHVTTAPSGVPNDGLLILDLDDGGDSTQRDEVVKERTLSFIRQE